MGERMDIRTGSEKLILYTGSYNMPILTGDGRILRRNGEGIRVFRFDEGEGTLEPLVCYPEVKNASWMTFSPDRKTLYAVNELDDYEGTGGGALTAMAVEKDGSLALRNCLPVMGAAPCHVNCDGSGGHVFTANYNGGSLSSFAVKEDGSLDHLDGQIRHAVEKDRPGGIDMLRQERAHVHSASVFDGHLWITDLGTDEISVYEPDGNGVVTEGGDGNGSRVCCSIRLPAGSGPRSLAFGGDGFVYVSCELSNRIAVLQRKGNTLHLCGSVPALPEEESAGETRKISFPGGVLLSADGRYLYVGNRGHDSIGVFRIGSGGVPEGVRWIPSGGKNPRGFQFSPSGKWMIVANQDSDNLVVFRRNEETGGLTEHGRYRAGAVVCLEFLQVEEG